MADQFRLQHATSTVSVGIFYMPLIYDMGQTALLPLRRKACWGFFRPKNPKASAGFEPANLGTRASYTYVRTVFPVQVLLLRSRRSHRAHPKKQYSLLKQKECHSERPQSYLQLSPTCTTLVVFLYQDGNNCAYAGWPPLYKQRTVAVYPSEAWQVIMCRYRILCIFHIL